MVAGAYEAIPIDLLYAEPTILSMQKELELIQTKARSCLRTGGQTAFRRRQYKQVAATLRMWSKHLTGDTSPQKRLIGILYYRRDLKYNVTDSPNTPHGKKWGIRGTGEEIQKFALPEGEAPPNTLYWQMSEQTADLSEAPRTRPHSSTGSLVVKTPKILRSNEPRSSQPPRDVVWSIVMSSMVSPLLLNRRIGTRIVIGDKRGWEIGVAITNASRR